MDYEKKYKEALERAKKFHTPDSNNSNLKAVLELVFPELAESEDERIRKAIIEVLARLSGVERILNDYGVEYNDAISYLEKQKEQKSTEDVVKDITKNKETATKFLKSAGIMDDDGELAEMYRSEQKPAEYIYITQRVLDYIDKNSKKYENKRPDLGDVWVVTKKITFPNAFNGKPVVEVEKDGFGWMRLPEEVVEVKNGQKKPAEWSEEAERHRNWILECLAKGKRKAPEYAEQYQSAFDWVLSLRPQRQKTENLIELYRPLAGTDIKDAIIECIAKAKVQGNIILAFNGWYQLVKGNSNVEALLASYYCSIQGQKEQKPIEKQDYSGLNDLERAIHRGFLVAGVENVPVTIIMETAQECLEQMKPAEWSEEDDMLMDELESYILYDKEFNDEQKSWRIKRLKSLRPQKLDASKLDNFDPVDVLNRIKTEWPMAWEKVVEKQEWSEEDEKIREELYEYFRQLQLMSDREFSPSLSIDKILSWLKPIRLQPKQEWSEEDERILKGIIGKIDHDQTYGVSKAEMLSFLESLRPQPKQDCSGCSENLRGYINGRNDALREMSDFINSLETPPQPHWKPTEEQMKALERTTQLANFGLEENRRKALGSLYSDLKKL